MALNIEDPEIERMARELARLTGQPITAVIREAIREKLASTEPRGSTPVGDDLSLIVRRGRERTTLDGREADEILGYDAHGLPFSSLPSPHRP